MQKLTKNEQEFTEFPMPKQKIYTTIQVRKGPIGKMLLDIAQAERRSKGAQIEYMIEREHKRIFGDGEAAHAPTEEPVNPFVTEMD